MKELVEVIATSLVDHPEEVVVTETVTDKSIVLELKVAPDDMGKVIGKQGRIAKAIRVVMRAAAVRQGEGGAAAVRPDRPEAAGQNCTFTIHFHARTFTVQHEAFLPLARFTEFVRTAPIQSLEALHHVMRRLCESSPPNY